MIAAVSDAKGRVVGIQRTFLARDFRSKAPVQSSRMMLGQVKGGAVRLALATDTLVIAEGIETALSVQQETKLPAWAALSATNFKSLALPALPTAKQIFIAAVSDETGLRAAQEAKTRREANGRKVVVNHPATPGYDWNDVLLKGDCCE